MAGKGFHSALLERERNRQLLADVLEQKYATERMHARIKSFAFLALGISAAFFFLKVLPSGNGGLKQTRNAGSSSLEIFAQVKKQLAENEGMLIDPSASRAATAEMQAENEHKGGESDYASNRVPLNLYGDMQENRAPKTKGPGDYREPSFSRKKEIGELQARAARRPQMDTGRYRPGVARDLPKLPHSRKQLVVAPNADLYRPLSEPPARLARDEGAFPARP